MTKTIKKLSPEEMFEIYLNAVQNYEESHPNWRLEVLISFVHWGLATLQHLLEHDQSQGVTWENALIDFDYEVGWKWERPGNGELAFGGHVWGTLQLNDLETEELAGEQLASVMAAQFNAMGLHDLTNGAWFEKKGKHYTPVLPVDLCQELNEIPSAKERRAVLEKLMRPFSIGAVSTDLEELPKEGKVSAKVARQLGVAQNGEAIPQVTIEIDRDGQKTKISLVFQVHPLIADYDQQKAYHTIVAGLIVHPEIKENEAISRTPADWSKAERKQFWDFIWEKVGEWNKELLPAEENQQAVILEANLKWKFPGEAFSPEISALLMQRIAALNLPGGHLVEHKVQTVAEASGQFAPAACPVCGWIHDGAFTSFQGPGATEVFRLKGVLSDIVACVHDAHAKQLRGLDTKSDELGKAVQGYRHPSKAFYDLKQSDAYQALFDTSRRGFLAMRRMRS